MNWLDHCRRLIESFSRPMLSPKNCTGCKYLYAEGLGYSNDQRTGTRVSCAKDRASQLPAELAPNETIERVSAALVQCDQFSQGRLISLDVIGKDGAGLFSTDNEQVQAIVAHSNRPAEGEPLSWALVNLVKLKAAG